MRPSRVKGAYFIFTLGFLLIFSSGFLAYLAWDGPGYHGSLAALEAPVTPPSLTPSTQSVQKKAGEKARPTATLEAPVVAPAPQPASADPVADQGIAAEVKSQEEPSSDLGSGPITVDSPNAKIVENKAQPTKQKLPRVHGKKRDENVPAPAETPKMESRKSQKKARKSRQAQSAIIDETTVPPEWNWFSTPLKLEVKDDKICIVSSSIEVAEEAKSVPAAALEKQEAATSGVTSNSNLAQKTEHEAEVAPVPATNAETDAAVVTSANAEMSDANKQRLTNLLARLQSRHESRAAEAKARSLILPSAKAHSKDSPDFSTGADEKAEAPAASATDVSLSDGLPPMPSAQPSALPDAQAAK